MLISGFVFVEWVFCSLIFLFSLYFHRVWWLFFWPVQLICSQGIPACVGCWDYVMSWEKEVWGRSLWSLSGRFREERKTMPVKCYRAGNARIWRSEVLQSSTCFSGRCQSNSIGDWSATTATEYFIEDFGLILCITCSLIIICISSYKYFNAIFWYVRTPCTEVIYKHTITKHYYT